MATIIVYISSVAGNLEVSFLRRLNQKLPRVVVGEEAAAEDWSDTARELQRE